MESGVGTLISFSTQPGNVALDGKGRNSPYAGALVNHVKHSSDSLSDLLIAVRNDVRKETQNKQVVGRKNLIQDIMRLADKRDGGLRAQVLR
jgi:uncharacterized caspase-like protein